MGATSQSYQVSSRAKFAQPRQGGAFRCNQYFLSSVNGTRHRFNLTSVLFLHEKALHLSNFLFQWKKLISRYSSPLSSFRPLLRWRMTMGTASLARILGPPAQNAKSTSRCRSKKTKTGCLTCRQVTLTQWPCHHLVLRLTIIGSDGSNAMKRGHVVKGRCEPLAPITYRFCILAKTYLGVRDSSSIATDTRIFSGQPISHL